MTQVRRGEGPPRAPAYDRVSRLPMIWAAGVVVLLTVAAFSSLGEMFRLWLLSAVLTVAIVHYVPFRTTLDDTCIRVRYGTRVVVVPKEDAAIVSLWHRNFRGWHLVDRRNDHRTYSLAQTPGFGRVLVRAARDGGYVVRKGTRREWIRTFRL